MKISFVHHFNMEVRSFNLKQNSMHDLDPKAITHAHLLIADNL
jgi:hypothetical protein